MIPTLSAPWLVLAALLLVGLAVRRGLRPARYEAWLAVALWVLALVPRLVWGLWGPLHVNGQGPLWVRGALVADALVGYGPGYFELLGWARWLDLPPDRVVFAANAGLSALAPALLWVTARLAGVARSGALAAAVVLAADPVLALTGASEWYGSPIIALVLGVQASLALGVRADARDDGAATLLAFAAAGLLAAAAARMHPIAYLPLALSPLVVLGAGWPERWPARLASTIAAASAIGAVVLATSGAIVLGVLQESVFAGSAITGLRASDLQLLAALLVVVIAVHRWVRPAWLPLLAIASLAALLATHDSFRQHPFWTLAYQRLFLPGILLGAAPLLPARAGMAGAVLTAAIAVVVLGRPARPYVDARTTEQLEYRFLQETLATVPAGCTVAAVDRVGKRVWEIPSYLVPGPPAAGVQRPLQRPEDLAPMDDPCVLYVRSSLCSSAEARELCAAIEAHSALEPIASRAFPAVPSYEDLPYDRPVVEVAVFRVPSGAASHAASRAPAVGDGAPITPELAQAIYQRLVALDASDRCRVVRFDTHRFRISVGLQAPAGPERQLGLAADGGRGERRAGAWTLSVPAALDTECPATLAALERALTESDAPVTAARSPTIAVAIVAASLALGTLAGFLVVRRAGK